MVENLFTSAAVEVKGRKKSFLDEARDTRVYVCETNSDGLKLTSERRNSVMENIQFFERKSHHAHRNSEIVVMPPDSKPVSQLKNIFNKPREQREPRKSAPVSFSKSNLAESFL